ncbi:sporulation initiation inhibitor Soj [Methylacidiphilum kamchatkense Kam1]|uniref:Chromosome partitioning protein n=1 Tax=Methylacidiphilum kamchatkense Kam1 TaxID=1202785 RepID=A0A0C1RV08_9BACT|nr:ParA family protein [Methylacidiphilum kamchatkense]KIE58781.1 sporulation initiation inhibitor Soj [Methylacidiphilum kamchatkense Kam1]QDQ41816.1 chromosome partitioning protein [Methylacidiphilum kamchatkense Kam1]
MKFISIANQKGGVGKTTTAINLSACLAEKGYSTLLVDVDPQSNATSGVGFSLDSGKSLFPVLIGEQLLKDQIISTPYMNLDLIPANLELANWENQQHDPIESFSVFRKIFRESLIGTTYQYVILDCPPALGLLMVNSMVAADWLIIPIQCEYYALEGLAKMFQLLDNLKKLVSAAPNILGILMTMYDSRTNLSQQVVEDVRKHIPKLVFDTIIPRTVRLAEAPSYGKPITLYDPNSIGCISYRKFTEEFLKKIN